MVKTRTYKGYKIEIESVGALYKVTASKGDYTHTEKNVTEDGIECAIRRSLKDEDKPIVLRMSGGCGNLEITYHYITEVTEKVIKQACNERAVTYYRRDDGYQRRKRETGLAAVCQRGLTGINKLNEWVEKHGKKTATGTRWNSGWKPRFDSKGRVNKNTPSLVTSSEF